MLFHWWLDGVGLNMPRKARIDAPGALHHVIVRGIEGGRFFDIDPIAIVKIS